ncbi:MAG: hypothetical protein V3R64_03660 [Sphingomonadales bacterium]
MNTQKYIIASIAASVFFFFYGFVVYALLLTDYVKGITPEGMQIPEADQSMLYIGLGCLVQGFMLTYIFIKGLENKGLMEGLRFGFFVGLFVFGIYLIWVGTSPLDVRAGLTFGIIDTIMYMGGGAVMAMLYKK